MKALIRSRVLPCLLLVVFWLPPGKAGAQEGPAYMVADLGQGTVASQFNPQIYGELDGRLYFAAYTSSTGYELFRTDGTPGGTELVADLCTGACSSQVISTTASAIFEDELYFAGCAGFDCRLWRTDGDRVTPVFEGRIQEILSYGDALYTTTADGEVRRGDGRSPGTLLFTAGAIPLLLVPAEGGLYVWATKGASLAEPQVGELWYTDGTEAGSRRIRSAAGLALQPLLFSGRALFLEGGRLFLGDPSGVEPLLADSPFTNPTVFDAADGVLFVSSGSRQLWRTDGTAAGTVLLDEVAPGENLFDLVSRVFEGEFYFARGASPALFRTTNGVGKTLVHEFPDPVRSLDVVGGALYAGTGLRPSALWRLDGDSSGPTQVATLAEREMFRGPVRYRDGLVFERLTIGGVGVSSQLAFVAAGGGEIVVLGWPESGLSSDPRELTRDRDRVLFRLASTFEAWVSDGTSEGTLAVAEPSSFRSIVRAGEEAFLRSSGLRRVESDGSLALVLEPPPGRSFVDGDAVVVDRGLLLLTESASGSVDLYLAERDTGSLELLAENLHRFTGVLFRRLQWAPLGGAALLILGEEALWRSDGTPEGTWPLLDITDVCDCSAVEPVRVGESVFFVSRRRSAGEEAPRLWQSDGTPEGTVVVRELRSEQGGPVMADRLAAAGERLFFVLTEPSRGAELWTSDGTEAGTVLVREINPGEGSGDPRGLVAVEARAGANPGEPLVFFSADDGVHGRELWTSDGTAEGTGLFLDLWPGPRGSDPRELTALLGHLVFTAEDGLHGAELWTSDGRAAGTRLAQDLQPGRFPGDPHSFTAAGDLVFFQARREATGAELWAVEKAALFDPLVALFDLPGIVVAQKPVRWRDASTGRPDRWCWFFGGDSGGPPDRPCDATTANVEHTFAEPGVYEVTLRLGRLRGDGTMEYSESSRTVEVRPLRLPSR